MKKNNHDEGVGSIILEKNINIENITLSRIAAMIVHDIKNPLNNILLTCSAMEEMQLPEEQNDCVKLIRRNSNRINTLMNDLIIASNELRLNLQPVNIHTLLKEVLHNAREAGRFNGIMVHYDYDEHIPHQLIDSELVKKALLQVLVNAFEAVDEQKGMIKITTRTADGVNCIIELQDNGNGITGGNEQEIFEPCFTTKPGHRGLGLAIARNILQQHNGSLYLLKTNNEGTFFAIHLNETNKIAG